MSDRIRTQPDVAFRPAGVGLHVTFGCARCKAHSSQHGSRWLMYGGIKQRVCSKCGGELEAKRAAAKSEKAAA